jgi:hypothetical protein
MSSKRRSTKHYSEVFKQQIVVRIEMAEERDRIKDLEAQGRELLHALAQTQIKALSLESVIESIDAGYGIDAKKFRHQDLTPLLKSAPKR